MTCALTTVSAVLRATSACAEAPSIPTDRELDSFELFLDRARGDRVGDDDRSGALSFGATATLGASSTTGTSFGVLGFVQVPFERLFAGSHRAPIAPMIVERPLPFAPSIADRAAPGARARSADPTARGPGAPAPSAPDRAAPATPPAVAPSPVRALLPGSKADPAARASPRPAPATKDPAASLPTEGARTTADPASARSSRPLAPLASAPPTPSPLDQAAAPPQPSEPAAPLPPPLLTPSLARGAVRAACKAAKLDDADARLDALASRARTSALLPELRLRATRAIDESESLAPTEYDASRRTASGSTTTWLEARATFRLDRLVFADDELDVERQRLARATERTKLVTKVLELLDSWQRARTTEDDRDAKPEVRTRATLAATSAEASLDVLTDGWFSKAISSTGATAASHVEGAPLAAASSASLDRPRADPANVEEIPAKTP